jgi:hypothetical protein
LAMWDNDLPMHLWDILIPQATITINLLQKSWTNPNLSVHAQVIGNFEK